MADWSPKAYLKFADERTRPASDLLAHVPLDRPRLIYDLGCGPGNSTSLLVQRYGEARIIGIDKSDAMLAAAGAALPGLAFEKADLAEWKPGEAADLLFSNAAFQWVPEHGIVMRRLVSSMRPGSVLAVQMPDNLEEPSHRLMEEVAQGGPWADKLKQAARHPLDDIDLYYSLLKPGCRSVDIWRTTYCHTLPGVNAVVDMLSSTGLRPYLDPLSEEERVMFLAGYASRLSRAYPAQADGMVLLRFPRLFIVAVR